MPSDNYVFVIDTDARCIFIRHYNLVNKAIILERSHAVHQHTGFSEDMHRLLDFTNCDLRLTNDEIWEIGLQVTVPQQSKSASRGAIIADTALHQGLARVYNSVSESRGVEYHTFTRKNANAHAELCAWFNLTADYEFPEFLDLHQT